MSGDRKCKRHKVILRPGKNLGKNCGNLADFTLFLNRTRRAPPKPGSDERPFPRCGDVFGQRGNFSFAFPVVTGIVRGIVLTIPRNPFGNSMRRVWLLPIGSSGDVNPFLWIGRLLHARGHAVSVVANPVFGDAIRALGLRHIPFGDEAEYHALLDHPDVWHPIKGPPLVLRYAGEVTQRYFDLLAREFAADPASELPLVLAPATAFGARLAREKFGFPLVSVHLQPCIFLTVGDTPLVGRAFGWLQELPPWAKRAFFAFVRARIGAEVNPGVRRACRTAGIAPPQNAFRDWWQSPDGGVCLWPEWFGPPQPEWGPCVANVGFPLYDLADQIALAPELEAFLAAGPPPVLFTPGTAMAQGAEFFATALAACQRANVRALFATKFPETLPALPPEIFHVSYAPFSALLPRCAGIVHHGGIGTTSQALAAGVPQLIRPFSHDQPDNAARVRRLGVGECLWPNQFTIENLAAALKNLLDDEARKQRCATIEARLRAERPADRLLAILEPHLRG
jgi:UDP:flavonoid glycosyltransferase YjiC (YdhE family)